MYITVQPLKLKYMLFRVQYTNLARVFTMFMLGLQPFRKQFMNHFDSFASYAKE